MPQKRAKRKIFSMRMDRPDVYAAFLKRGRRHADSDLGDTCSNCRHWLPTNWCPVQRSEQMPDGLCALHDKAAEVELQNP